MAPVQVERAPGAGERLHLDGGLAVETLEAAPPPGQEGHEAAEAGAEVAGPPAQDVEEVGQADVGGEPGAEQGAEEGEAVRDDGAVRREGVEELPRPEVGLAEAEQGAHVEHAEDVVEELEGQAAEGADALLGEGPLEGRGEGEPDAVVLVGREPDDGAAELVAVVGRLLYDVVDLGRAERVHEKGSGGWCWFRRS